jgi:hypothetical protein
MALGWMLTSVIPDVGDATLPTSNVTSVFYSTGLIDVTLENKLTILDGAQIFTTAIDAREAQGAIQKERPELLIDLKTVTITVTPVEPITLVE